MRFPALVALVLGVIWDTDGLGRTVAVYGDSFSAGSGTDLRGPKLWPNKLQKLLGGERSGWTVVNYSINGNGLVWKTRCFGLPAMDRLEADLPELPAETQIVLMAGVNDVIQPALPRGFSTCFEPIEFSSPEITERLAGLARARSGHRILLATIPPFKGSQFHSTRAEIVREQVNHWIKAHWPNEDIIDLAGLLADRDDRLRLRREFDSGDGLHPNEHGAAVIAAVVTKMLQ